MVYALGSLPTLGHYSNQETLDGDVFKIEVADKTADAGFDANTAATYPARQGCPILTQNVSTKIEWQESSPVPDIETVHGALVVSEKFRQIVERFEPGIHQFLPVNYLDRQGMVLVKRYVFVASPTCPTLWPWLSRPSGLPALRLENRNRSDGLHRP